MSKKINIFVNDKYICSSLKYKTCKEAKEAVYKAGFIEWAGINFLTIGEFDRITISEKDVVKAHFEK